ncbi:EF-hand calcium-binding domain-containing protein 6 [Plakobranchus ocellatus]|uniref:EF-hand calcium-binding domain-containing protein 6 n=1 Tax=Plakobranchus ocellatus TaxID=259542 RepID=A0AAV3ZSK0_9GAST|nr:EF-hand calcium-binding domain-containing protein 6 [Plakobranchus ocellatus]
MFQRDFLALLGMFKKIDNLGTDVISQEEFRAAIESRFNMELTNSQFESFLDRVPLDEEGNVMYTRFMQQFDANLDDEPKSGRPKTSTNEENTTRVDELIRCDRMMKIREIALKLKIPKSTVHEIVHDTLGYRKVSARWVPKMLTEGHKLQRVEISQRLLQRCQQDNGDEDTTHIGVGPGGDFQANNNFFDNLITGDET